MTITDDQIRTLRVKASQVGDFATAAICTLALTGRFDAWIPLRKDEADRIRPMSQAVARAACERIVDPVRSARGRVWHLAGPAG